MSTDAFDAKVIVHSLLNVSSEEFIPLCYRTLLRREFDEEGLTSYAYNMHENYSRIKIIEDISCSPEANQFGICKDVVYQLKKAIVQESVIRSDKVFDWISWAISLSEDCKTISSIIGEPKNKDLQISPKEMALVQQLFINNLRKSFADINCLPDIRRFVLESAILEPDLETLEGRFKRHYLETDKWVYHYFMARGNKANGVLGGVAQELDYRVITELTNDNSVEIINSSRADEVVVIGVTTLGRPSLTMALQSLLSQRWPDGSPLNVLIVLSVPKSLDVNIINTLLSPLGNDINKIIINHVSDYGPITKLVGALTKTTVDNDIVLLADDDVTYPKFHFATLINYYFLMGGRFAVGASGFNWKLKLREYSSPKAEELGYESVEGHLAKVDIIETWCGVCLSRKWFDDDFINAIRSALVNDPDILRQDDVFYSTYLSSKGVQKLNINSDNCNRYEAGFSVEQEELKSLNKGLVSLNGDCSRQMNWVRTLEHLSGTQRIVFNNIKKTKSNRRIALATICVGKDYTDDMWPGIQSKVEYCDKHGYEFIFVRESLNKDLPLIWSKFHLIERLLLDGYDIIFYSDADVVITNPTIRIEGICDSYEGDILVSQDVNGINVGNMFIRNSSASIDLIRKCLHDERFHFNSPWYEQAALVYHVTNDQEFSNTISVCQKNIFNSYVNDWAANDFLVHLAGVYGRASRTIIRAFRDLSTGTRNYQQVIQLLSPFFPDYTPDPARRINLTPKTLSKNSDKLNHQDVYVINNNMRLNNKFVIIYGEDRHNIIESFENHNDILLFRGDNLSDVSIEKIVLKRNSSIIAVHARQLNECINLFEMLSKYSTVLFVFLVSKPENNCYEHLSAIKNLIERYKGNSIVVRVEDVVSDPNQTIELVGDFIGVKNLTASFRDVCLSHADGEGLLDFFGYRGSSSCHRDQDCKRKNEPIDFLL